jgi:aspartate racemase
MVEETAKHIAATYGENVKVGLLATTGTVKTNIYQQVFYKVAPKISVLVPDEESQAEVMKACYDIKKFSVDEKSFELLNKAAKNLINQGAQVIILGCTEIPLALTKQKCEFKRVDPMEILAKEVIEKTLTSNISLYRKILNKFQLPLPQLKVVVSK